MGCIISSKIITKSNSHREDYLMNQSQSQRTFLALDDDLLDELFISKNGGHDHFLALVSSADDNMGTGKGFGSTAFPYSDDQISEGGVTKFSVISPTNNNTVNDTIDFWELMSDLEEENDQVEQQQLLSLPRTELKPMPNRYVVTKKVEGNLAGHKKPDNNNNNNNKNSDNKGMGILIKSKSFHFHTLQEYDEFVEREKLRTCSSKTTCHDCIGEEDNIAAERDKSMLITAEDPTPFVFAANKESTPRKGNAVLRRKAMAKDLALLRITIPTSLSTSNGEFAAAVMGMGRERFDDSIVVGEHQQVYNNYYYSEEYVTPKFGSFNSLPVPVYRVQRSKFGTGNSTSNDDASVDDEEESVFESEMVAAYEKAMRQFQVEEEWVLKQITEENFEEIISNVGGFEQHCNNIYRVM